MISNELLRLSELTRAKEDEIQTYKKREYELNVKLKQQKEWDSENKNLREVVEGKGK